VYKGVKDIPRLAVLFLAVAPNAAIYRCVHAPLTTEKASSLPFPSGCRDHDPCQPRTVAMAMAEAGEEGHTSSVGGWLDGHLKCVSGERG